MKDPLKDYWFQVEIQKSPYGNIEIFARLDMTEKKIKSAISPKFICGDPKFFLAILRPLRDLQTTTKNLNFILLKMSTRAKSWFAHWKTGKNFKNS